MAHVFLLAGTATSRSNFSSFLAVANERLIFIWCA